SRAPPNKAALHPALPRFNSFPEQVRHSVISNSFPEQVGRRTRPPRTARRRRTTTSTRSRNKFVAALGLRAQLDVGAQPLQLVPGTSSSPHLGFRTHLDVGAHHFNSFRTSSLRHLGLRTHLDVGAHHYVGVRGRWPRCEHWPSLSLAVAVVGGRCRWSSLAAAEICGL